MADAPSTSRDDGDWEAWGGYMNAKKQKLSVQFTKDRTKEQTDGELSDLFAGVAIFVNGYTGED
uniref:Uncharacterized protein n=1 Tax=Plectus sambesii TaxID=2011161 RepID=A0A914VNQ7_9BILA